MKWYIFPLCIISIFIALFLYNLFRQPSSYKAQETVLEIPAPNISTTLTTVIESDWDKDLSAISKKLPGGIHRTEYQNNTEINSYTVNVHLDCINLNSILKFEKNKTTSTRILTIAANSKDQLEKNFEVINRMLSSSDIKSTVLKDFENNSIVVKMLSKKEKGVT